MSISERDFILRAIKQIGQALAAIARLRKSGRAEQALVETGATVDRILGPMASTIDKLDPQSAAVLLGEPERLRAYGLLVAERSAIHRTLGNEAAAQRDRVRAIELLGVWMKQGGEMDDDVRAALEQLRDA